MFSSVEFPLLSFLFSFPPFPVMGWNARPRLAQLLLLSCIFIFVFELKIKMFLENHPTSVQCRVKPFSRMSLSMGLWWDFHLADLWRKSQVRSAPCKRQGNGHRERNVWAAKLFDRGRSAGLLEQGALSARLSSLRAVTYLIQAYEVSSTMNEWQWPFNFLGPRGRRVPLKGQVIGKYFPFGPTECKVENVLWPVPYFLTLPCPFSSPLQ